MGIAFSEDGRYWWDGQAWQLLSSDRLRWWDGSDWEPLPAEVAAAAQARGSARGLPGAAPQVRASALGAGWRRH